MPLTPAITPSPSLQQAQQANTDAQRANVGTANAQISGGIGVGSTGTYNPGDVQTSQMPLVAPPPQNQTVGGVTAIPKPLAPSTGAGGVTPTPVMPNTQAPKPATPAPAPGAEWIGTVKPAIPGQPLAPTAPKPATPATGQTPATPGQPQAPQMPDLYGNASTEQKQSADSMMNIIDPTGNLSPAAQADIKNAFLSGNPADMQRIANVYGMDATNTANFINAVRTTRDASLQESRMTSQADIATQRAMQEYDTAIAQQEARVKATANNMSIGMDTAGRLQSQNMATAIVDEMKMQQRILSNLQQSKSWALAGIASDAKYQHDVLANNYNDAMSQYDASIQQQIKSLNDTGMAKTAEGLSMLQSNIEKTQLAKLQLGQQYAQSLKSATEIMKMQVEKTTPNIDITNQINDGYLHSSSGEVVMGPSGKPLVSNPQKKLSTTTTDNNGNIIGIYSDGTHSVISEGQPVGPRDIHNYAKAVQAGGESILKMLPQNVQQQVLAYMGQAGMIGLDMQMKQQELGFNQGMDIEKLNIQKQQLAQQGWKDMGDGSGKMINPNTKEVWDPNQQGQGVGVKGADLVKALASGNYGGKNFFGVYATGDAQGNQRASIYNTIQSQGLDAYMQRVAPNAPITPEMVRQGAMKAGIEPEVLATFLQADSGFGTKGLGATNNNPGNVGQFDRYGSQAVKGYATMQEGIDAAAENLAKRQSALMDMTQKAGMEGKYDSKNDQITQVKTEAGKILTMKSEPANALKSVLDSNPDIKIDYNNLYRTQEDQYKLFGKGRSASQMVTAGVPEEFARKYADPMNKQVTWTLQSKHMSGSAVDVVNPTPEVVKAMNQVGFFQPDDPWMRQNDAGHFEYKGVAQPIQGQGGYNEAQSPSYQKYLDKGILPTGIKEGTAKADQFESEALAYQENKKNNPTLSSGAKQAMDTKTITGTPAQKDAIANELYDAGVLNEQTGNKNYYLKDEKEKQGMLTAIKAKEAVDRVKAIYDKHVRAGDANEFLGGYDQAFINAKRGTGISTEFTRDYTEMEKILGTELSRYMNQISGATVGDREVDRLKQQIPNLGMNEEQFNNAINDYSNTLQSTEDFLYKNNGFKDRNTFYQVAGAGGQPQSSAPAQTGGAPDQARVDRIKALMKK